MKMLKETSLKITEVSTFLSIFFYLSEPQQSIYINGEEILC